MQNDLQRITQVDEREVKVFKPMGKKASKPLYSRLAFLPSFYKTSSLLCYPYIGGIDLLSILCDIQYSIV